MEEGYATFSYSPIPDDQGSFGGILCPVTEETQRIIGERQLALLRELATRTADARTWREAYTLAANALETNSDDLPFVLLYAVDAERRSASLVGISGIARGAKASPETVLLDSPCLWPLEEVRRTRQACLIPDLSSVSDELPVKRGRSCPTQAISIPISPSGDTGAAGFGVLVVGLNPFRLFDDNYQRFLELVAGGISAAVTNSEAYEAERRRAEALAELDRGMEGLRACAEFGPALVFLDIGMPGMDGFETARRLRESPASRKATLIALTGWGEENTRRRVMEGGFDRHLTKPVAMGELEALLAAASGDNGGKIADES